MLRLWPESLAVGLFPDHCWLQRGRLPATLQPGAGDGDPAALANTMRQMLPDAAQARWSAGRLDITLSDRYAAVCALPWQDDLSKRDELQIYARLCFENAGYALDDSWVLHAEFRHHGALGIAYAVPRALLEACTEVAAQAGVRLRTVMPVSALGYFRPCRVRRAEQRLLLCLESHHIAAMVHDANGMIAFDMEPAAATPERALQRLLHRLLATHDRVNHVQLRVQDKNIDDLVRAVIRTALPGASQQSLLNGAWS